MGKVNLHFGHCTLSAHVRSGAGRPGLVIWATQKQQASIVYEAAKNFAFSSSVLRNHVKTKRDKDNSEMLLYPARDSFLKAGSKNSESQDGLNPHAAIIDELQAIKNRNTYDVFSSAMGARAQPIMVIISTFGFVREGIFDSVLERCVKVLNGKSKERIFPDDLPRLTTPMTRQTENAG